MTALTEDQVLRLRHLDRVLGRQTHEFARLAEALEVITRRLVAIERHLGVVEEPACPRPTRRDPCARRQS